MRIRERNQDSILPLLLAIAIGALGLITQDLMSHQEHEAVASVAQCEASGPSLHC